MKAPLVSLLLLAAPLWADDTPPPTAGAPPNAALLYQEAAKQLPPIKADQREMMVNASFLNQLKKRSPEEIASLRELVEQSKPALEKMREAAALPECQWGSLSTLTALSPNNPYGNPFLNGPLPHFLPVMTLCRVALLQAYFDLESGREAEAVKSMSAALRLMRSYCRDFPLSGTWEISQSLETGVVTLTSGHFSSLSPEQIGQIIAALEDRPIHRLKVLREDCNLVLNWLQRIDRAAEHDPRALTTFRRELSDHMRSMDLRFPERLSRSWVRREIRMFEENSQECLYLAAMLPPEDGTPIEERLNAPPNSLFKSYLIGSFWKEGWQRTVEVERAALRVALKLREAEGTLPPEVVDEKSGITFRCRTLAQGLELMAVRKVNGQAIWLEFH